MQILFLLSITLTQTLALDNGLAMTPPMGWQSRQRFRCITDCWKYPDECVGEDLIRNTVDVMVRDGYLEAGYNYIGLDDCWSESTRGPNGELLANKDRFPNGIKAVIDYVHKKGLKYGVFHDFGPQTCAGYPGLQDHLKQDVETILGWGADYVKLDACHGNFTDVPSGLPEFEKLLNESSRALMYSCRWPAYLEEKGVQANYSMIVHRCNTWRNWKDMQDSWVSLKGIIDWIGDNQERFLQLSGPGHWHDPDVLLIGNFGLSESQARLQMAIWTIMAAPLIISTDLAKIKPYFKDILLNKDVLAVHQDRLLKPGMRVYKDPKTQLEIWNRELSDNAYALAFIYSGDEGAPRAANFTFNDMNLPKNNYAIKNLFRNEYDRTLLEKEDFEVRVKPTGVRFYKFTPTKQEDIMATRNNNYRRS